MKKEKRAAYNGLCGIELPPMKGMEETTGGYPIMCSFCRYSLWLGSPCDWEDECQCTHPLMDKYWWGEDLFNRVQEGSDCWLFHPYYRIEDAADMVGIWLKGEYTDMGGVEPISKKYELVK